VKPAPSVTGKPLPHQADVWHQDCLHVIAVCVHTADQALQDGGDRYFAAAALLKTAGWMAEQLWHLQDAGSTVVRRNLVRDAALAGREQLAKHTAEVAT
jgi:hypothetical protein